LLDALFEGTLKHLSELRNFGAEEMLVNRGVLLGWSDADAHHLGF
jgi:hypothetical protein